MNVLSSKHIEVKHKLQAIPSIAMFENLLEQSTLTDEEKEFVRLYYLRGKPLGYIADSLGFTEGYIRNKHRKIINKLSSLI